MNEIEQIVEILERHLSPLNARALVQRALKARRFKTDSLPPGEMREFGASLHRGLRLFLNEAAANQALQDIFELCNDSVKTATPSTVPVNTENDIITARMEARRICDDLGAKSFATQKVTTIVSELARNIVSYTPGGTLEIGAANGRQRRIVIRAIDSGPGIPNLGQILAGKYQSKTGLGRGILGTKRLADHFDISTGARGTSITAEIDV
jgi:serine/threonine-protein kinase RsbT